MFVDLAAGRIGKDVATDIAVIGAGPAGITLARQLARHGRTVCLLESGGLEYSDEAQQLNRGVDAVAHGDYLEISRIRVFGGTSFHWGGWCRPLDPVDFQVRPWIRDSGWPIDAAALAPFYPDAARICDLDSTNFSLDYWQQQRHQPAFPLPRNEFDSSYFQISKPTRFGEKYRDELAGSDRITTYLNATVRSIELHPDGQKCDHLTVLHPDGSPFRLSARQYVVACGGVENARLLLLSNSVMKQGIGNDRDLVGRFYMDHPAFTSGGLAAAKDRLKAGFYDQHASAKFRGFGTLVPSDELCAAMRSPRFNIELMLELDSTAQSLGKLKSDYWSITDSIKKGNLLDEVGANLTHLLGMIANGSEYAYHKLLHERVAPSYAHVRVHLETTPNPDSRVTLDPVRKDRFGAAEARLAWRINPEDFRGWARAQRRLAEVIGAAGIGRVKVEVDQNTDFSRFEYETSYHQVGTTRMHDAPSSGVVDRDCKMHGLGNLYVAGSSVFSTCGHANPTLTIVAMALRLGDHLKEPAT